MWKYKFYKKKLNCIDSKKKIGKNIERKKYFTREEKINLSEKKVKKYIFDKRRGKNIVKVFYVMNLMIVDINAGSKLRLLRLPENVIKQDFIFWSQSFSIEI